jgi:hypothetical protein
MLPESSHKKGAGQTALGNDFFVERKQVFVMRIEDVFESSLSISIED